MLTTTHEVLRYGLNGESLGVVKLPHMAYHLVADASGHVAWFLTDKARELSAWDLEGRKLWTYNSPAAKSPPFMEALLTDLEQDGTAEILLSDGEYLRCLNADGAERWATEAVVLRDTLATGDVNADGKLEILFEHRPSVEIHVLDSAGLVQTHWKAGPLLNSLHSAVLEPNATPGIVAVGMSRRPNQDGRRTQQLEFWSTGGEVLGVADLPFAVFPISSHAVTSVDTDGDGRKAWLIAGQDGAFYLFSADGKRRETHYTGKRLHAVGVLPQAGGAEHLVTGTHRGLSVWQRVPGKESAVD